MGFKDKLNQSPLHSRHKMRIALFLRVRYNSSNVLMFTLQLLSRLKDHVSILSFNEGDHFPHGYTRYANWKTLYPDKANEKVAEFYRLCSKLRRITNV